MTPIREENTSIKSKRKEHRGLHIVDKCKLCIPNESSHAVLVITSSKQFTNKYVFDVELLHYSWTYIIQKCSKAALSDVHVLGIKDVHVLGITDVHVLGIKLGEQSQYLISSYLVCKIVIWLSGRRGNKTILIVSCLMFQKL